MRRQSELRTASQNETGSIPVKSVKSGAHETLPTETLERRILSSINEMERMMEDTFHRPFFGMNTLPFRHLFHEMGSFGDITPSVDIYQEKGEVIVKAELPGMKREDVSVKIVDKNLIIAGEKKTEERVERKDYLRLERSHGSFNRTLSLPEGIDAEHVKANFSDGVLEVRVPIKGAKGSVREITVN